MADPADRLQWNLLVLRCRLGDRAAFEDLVGRCQPRLRAFLFKMLLGRLDVDDLAQDVWLDVLRGLPRLQDPGAFVPWLYRIAHNRVLRVLRRREPLVFVPDEQIDQEPHESDDFAPEDAAAVHAALDLLGAEYREVLLLRFMENMSYQEIATVVGCNVGTVRSRLHNAKRTLRERIERQVHHDAK